MKQSPGKPGQGSRLIVYRSGYPTSPGIVAILPGMITCIRGTSVSKFRRMSHGDAYLPHVSGYHPPAWRLDLAVPSDTQMW
jgi:hypothetical protein